MKVGQEKKKALASFLCSSMIWPEDVRYSIRRIKTEKAYTLGLFV
jgi:hypothetical protein